MPTARLRPLRAEPRLIGNRVSKLGSSLGKVRANETASRDQDEDRSSDAASCSVPRSILEGNAISARRRMAHPGGPLSANPGRAGRCLLWLVAERADSARRPSDQAPFSPCAVQSGDGAQRSRCADRAASEKAEHHPDTHPASHFRPFGAPSRWILASHRCCLQLSRSLAAACRAMSS
jgi:hypothetical protein